MKSKKTKKSGRSYTVAPLRKLEDVERIRKMLIARGEYRNALIFCIGTNNGLRAGDILSLKIRDVLDLSIGEVKRIREQKTKKPNVIVLNKICHRILQQYLSAHPELKDTDYLFPSRKAKGKLDPRSLNALVQKWTREAGLTRERYGSHTLRKTFGYIQRTKYGVGFEVLAKRFNHSSPAITMRYLGIEDKEVTDILMHEI